MRKIGYALLIFGFIFLLAGVFLVRPAARAIVLRHYDHVSSQQSFTREQVQQQTREPVFELVDSMPWFVLPGLVMFIGGVCLDRARRL